MITLSQRIKKQQKEQQNGTGNRISVRDRLLVREVPEMHSMLPANCNIVFDNLDILYAFKLVVKPTEGFWQGGTFRFAIEVTEEYNMVPPLVKCLTKLWHPNINEVGAVCLSLLRQHSVDEWGWSPTRTLNDVVWGLHALFTDLLNFEDPLNIEAAEMYFLSKEAFGTKVKEYVNLYARE